MTTAKHHILIVGGGTAGISVAARLQRKGHRRRRRHRAVERALLPTAVDPRRRRSGEGVDDPTVRGLGDAQGCDMDQERCHGRRPRKQHGHLLRRGGLRVRRARGLSRHSTRLESHRGTAGCARQDGVSSNYRFDLAPRTWDFIRNTRSGSAVFMMPSGPIKCAGAPQKIAYLASDYWRKQGVSRHDLSPRRSVIDPTVRHPGDR